MNDSTGVELFDKAGIAANSFQINCGQTVHISKTKPHISYARDWVFLLPYLTSAKYTGIVTDLMFRGVLLVIQKNQNKWPGCLLKSTQWAFWLCPQPVSQHC